MGKASHFNKQYWENQTTTWRRMKLNPYLTPYIKINSKRIKDINIVVNSLILVLEMIFFGFDTKRNSNKSKKKNKLDYIKLKYFCTAKETINQRKRQPREWEEIFESHISDNGLVHKCIMNSYNSIAKKKKIQLLKMSRWTK